MNRRSDWFAMRLSREERAQIELLAEREGVPFSVAVRAAIRKALEINERTPAAKQKGALVCVNPS
jgi:predicted DNA-binding protein